MPRLKAQISGKRLRELVIAALQIFSRQGYERSQVADVAKVMGVAPGTIYLYVEGKEALFDLIIRHTASDDPDWLDNLEVPIPTPAPGTTLEFLREVLGRKGQWPLLETALRSHSTPDIRSELDGVVREQYRLMTRHRAGLVLLTRSALEFPGLVEVFVLGLRKRLLDSLGQYLQARMESRQIRALADTAATAAVLTQTIVWANLQRPFDPGLSAFTEQTIEDATVDLIVSGLLNPTTIA
ncbi:MAG: TetR/AcrR family transcriptional regulator [Verrucomicrobia bacterium]|nr:TetR/AcrR family transcriptional regulator [Verrucomicrobiota bacterium]